MFGKKCVFLFLVCFILFYGCCNLIPPDGGSQDGQNGGSDYGPNGDDNGNGGYDGGNGVLDGGNSQDDDDQPDPIPPGTIALFYVTYLGGDESETGVSDYYGNPISVDSSSRAVVMYLPELDELYAIKTYTSYSYSENVVYPYTASGKFFVVRDWGSDWSGSGDTYNNHWDIEEFDEYTGQLKSTTGITADQFAIAGDIVYFTYGGILKAVELGGDGYYATDLQYASGMIYGVGNHLISVGYDYSGEYVTFSIREHDLYTGEITKTLYDNVPTNPTADKVYPGEEAIYQVQSDGNMRYIYRYPIVGEEESFSFELLEGESGIYVAEEDGILAIFIQSDNKITDVLLHDLNTGAEGWLELEPYSILASFTRIGIPFLVLD